MNGFSALTEIGLDLKQAARGLMGDFLLCGRGVRHGRTRSKVTAFPSLLRREASTPKNGFPDLSKWRAPAGTNRRAENLTKLARNHDVAIVSIQNHS